MPAKKIELADLVNVSIENLPVEKIETAAI